MRFLGSDLFAVFKPVGYLLYQLQTVEVNNLAGAVTILPAGEALRILVGPDLDYSAAFFDLFDRLLPKFIPDPGARVPQIHSSLRLQQPA